MSLTPHIVHTKVDPSPAASAATAAVAATAALVL